MSDVMAKKKIPSDEPVADFLRDRGCPPHIVEEGLKGLVERWEGVVESISRGYALGLDDYLNDLDGRELLEGALAVASEQEREKYRKRILRADRRMKALVKPAGKCLWGNDTAKREGWAPEKNWWYFSRPIDAGPDLLSELGKE